MSTRRRRGRASGVPRARKGKPCVQVASCASRRCATPHPNRGLAFLAVHSTANARGAKVGLQAHPQV
eukprot:5430266-Prymnesium_polylepis.1